MKNGNKSMTNLIKLLKKQDFLLMTKVDTGDSYCDLYAIIASPFGVMLTESEYMLCREKNGIMFPDLKDGSQAYEYKKEWKEARTTEKGSRMIRNLIDMFSMWKSEAEELLMYNFLYEVKVDKNIFRIFKDKDNVVSVVNNAFVEPIAELCGYNFVKAKTKNMIASADMFDSGYTRAIICEAKVQQFHTDMMQLLELVNDSKYEAVVVRGKNGRV